MQEGGKREDMSIRCGSRDLVSVLNPAQAVEYFLRSSQDHMAECFSPPDRDPQKRFSMPDGYRAAQRSSEEVLDAMKKEEETRSANFDL